MVGEVAAVPVEVGCTDGAATTGELPSGDKSVSLFGDPVADVKLPSPSVPLVKSESVVWPSMAMWDAAPSCSGATVPLPDDADVQKDRESRKESFSAWHTATVGGQDKRSSPLHYAVILPSAHAIPGKWPTWQW
ncbi:hypothetical protein NDU88_001647 [Pleurodeles waltl]|uniref:Uncharacterized protein n=1 Tax=Pleurodeles waltl TaxID=8319 RepID=A0AAV7NBQ9_PLEWA|nr:hypothetical protein NDU88_001647 [Pleurodeles waltl]